MIPNEIKSIADPADISEDEKEHLFSYVINLELDESDVSDEDILKVFHVSQEVLKFKGEQVESLISELDNLAVKLGEIEVERQHSVYDEEAIGNSSSSGAGVRSKSSADPDYHRELVKMEIRINQLVSESQQKDEELVNAKKEIEKMTEKIQSLEDENRSLTNELQAVQQEMTSNAATKLPTDTQDFPSMEKYHELTELLRQKNKHITQLLNDVEDIEKENIILKDELTYAKNELADGVEQMSKLSMERLSLKACVDKLKDGVSKLEHENSGLRNQIAELIAEKENRDKHLEIISSNYEKKLEQWKNISQEKDTELTSLRLSLHSSSLHSGFVFNNSGHYNHLNDLTKKLAEREDRILELQRQLEQATVDLKESTQILEDQRELLNVYVNNKFDDSFKSNNAKQLNKELEQYRDRMSILEAKADDAEEESFKKAQEVSELIIQLREYESGTYGLEDAMAHIKELQKQKQVRDAQIEQLVHNSNELKDEVNLLEQENQILRGRLGISQIEPVVVEDISRRNRDRHNELMDLNERLEKCQNELLSYRLENRKLKKQIPITEAKTYPSDGGTHLESSEPDSIIRRDENISVGIQSNLEDDHEKNEFSDTRLKDVIDENEGLRKGLHEILDSIKNKDVSSVVQVESEILEQLLESLDSRHVTGWYQPAMRLQANIHHLNGVNQRLREELHYYREREEELLKKLSEVSWRLNESGNATEITKPFLPSNIVDCPSPQKSFTKEVEDAHQTSYAILEKDLENEKAKTKSLTEQIDEYREKCDLMEERQKRLEERYNEEKAEWSVIKTAMRVESEEATSDAEIQRLRADEHEKTLETLKQSPEEINRAFIESKLGISSLRTELRQFCRKYDFLAEAESQLRLSNKKLSDELYSTKVSKDQEIIQLRKTNDQLSAELRSQTASMNEYVDRVAYEKVNRDLNQLTVKHRNIMQKQILLNSERDRLISRLQNESKSLREQKTDLEVSLKAALEEKIVLSSKSHNVDETIPQQVAVLIKQVSDLELDVLNKKQYSDHLDRMHELTKEQLKETENRCKQLIDQLELAVESNSKLQTNEANLMEELLKLPNMIAHEELVQKLKEVENDNTTLRIQKNEIEDLAKVAQDQVKTLEEYYRRQDFEFDSMQRRLLELQSHSDETVIIDRLTKELVLLQQTGIDATNETNNMRDKLSQSESEILRLKLTLSEYENNYNKLKRDDGLQMERMHMIVQELQKRYLGSFPLLKEDLCCENLLNFREEYNALLTLVSEVRPLSIFAEENSKNGEVGNIRVAGLGEGSHQFLFKIRDFEMKLINEGLKNKIDIYVERLERQERLIKHLEQQIIQAGQQCEEFLLFWSPQSKVNYLTEIGDRQKYHSKHTQTKNGNWTDLEEQFDGRLVRSDDDKILDELNPTNENIEELRKKLETSKGQLCNIKHRITNLSSKLEEKELAVSNKEEEISRLTQMILKPENGGAVQILNTDDDKSINNTLKVTVGNLQNIISQKEDIIKRLQMLTKENGETYSRNMVQLSKELKILQDAVDAKDRAYNILKIRLDALERKPNEKRPTISTYLTRIHKLEDQLEQSNEKVERLTSQLAESTQLAEQWTRIAEERLQKVENTKSGGRPEAKRGIHPAVNEKCQLSYSALLQLVKEKTDLAERQNQALEELRKKLECREKLFEYRDQLRTDIDKYKKKIEVLEQRENERNTEIQRLKDQLSSRFQSARKKETLVTPKEEQLLKKIKTLEERVEEYADKERKWAETRRVQVDNELERWQSKKHVEQSQEKLRQQVKDLTAMNRTLKLNNDRLKRTIIRLEKERMALDGKLKNFKSQSATLSIAGDWQTNNIDPSVAASILDAQERRIEALEIARKSDLSLFEGSKSKSQMYSERAEEENFQIKPEKNEMYSLDDTTKTYNISEDLKNKIKGKQKRDSDSEKAIFLLRRVVEKLQAENERLRNNKMTQIQDKSYVERLRTELQNLNEKYLDMAKKSTVLNAELGKAHGEIEMSHKMIERLQNGEEISSLKLQLFQKTHILNRAKVLIEKTVHDHAGI